MIGANESKSSAQIQSAFSIVKDKLFDPSEFTQEFYSSAFSNISEDSFNAAFPDQFHDVPYSVSEDEFLSLLRDGPSLTFDEPRKSRQIVRGISEARVIRIDGRPVTTCSDYQRRIAEDTGRPSVGLFYSPNRTWSDEDSVIAYFGILDSLSKKVFAEEQRCDLYETMLHKATLLFIAENRSFVEQLKKLQYLPNWLEEDACGMEMAIDLPNGNRVVFDDF